MSTNEITILGQTYTIKGIDDVEYLNKLAEHVDYHMRLIATNTSTVDTRKVAILAALTIADEYFSALKGAERKDQDLERSIQALCDQIDATIDS